MNSHLLDDEEIVDWLFQHGASANAGPNNHTHVISLAVAISPIPTVDMLFEHGGCVMEGQLLHNVIERKGDPEERNQILRMLLKKGAPTDELEHSPAWDFRGQKWGFATPMTKAIHCKQPDTLRILLEHGADMWHTDAWRRAPKGIAILTKQDDCLRILDEWAEKCSRL